MSDKKYSMSSRSLIQKKKEEDGYVYIQVPFHVKNLFKKAFRKAKWDPDTKTWFVKKRKDLEARIERFNAKLVDTGLNEAYDKELEIDEMEKMIEEMAEEEMKVFSELNRRYEETKRRYRALQHDLERREESEKIRKLIEEKEAEILKLYGEAARARDEAAQNEKVIREKVGGLIDEEKLEHFDEVWDSAERAYRRDGFLRANVKSKISEAREPLLEMRETLEKIGIRSLGIDCRIDLNPNRMDRDKLDDCPEVWELREI